MTGSEQATCQPCGACCRLCGIPPGSVAWKQTLPASLAAEINRRLRGDPAPGVCVWYDEGVGCRHYGLRPQTCRDFEVGGSHCRRMRDRFGVTAAFVPLTVTAT